MSSTKHTPGPWTTPDAYPNAIQVTSASGWICSLEVNKVNATEEQKANARLIAAAPELLRVAELAATLNTQTNHIGSGMLSELVERARAAIAKATNG
jgi:hypothetical protein